MSTTAEHIGAARAHRPTMATLRLRLKPAHRYCGFVQGGWWLRSTRLTVQLPSLLTALSLRFGPIARVRYHQSDWSPTPPSIKHQGDNVILDASKDSPNVITVFGERIGRLALLLVPPYADARRRVHGDDNGGKRGQCFHPRPTTRNQRAAERHGSRPLPVRATASGMCNGDVTEVLLQGRDRRTNLAAGG
ncbi:MAG TPA: DUF5994 family protein [Mycobacterium sp.]|uniref:DUF5994 family protein n=1 Tax=Mycobacterium sp. TaxID=1785 RepID=UPI002F416BB7